MGLAAGLIEGQHSHVDQCSARAGPSDSLLPIAGHSASPGLTLPRPKAIISSPGLPT
jgi:hypothetical protein